MQKRSKLKVFSLDALEKHPFPFWLLLKGKCINRKKLDQGQARGYGRITHFLPLPTWGHDFPWAIVNQPVGIFQTPGCHMKDMDIIFPQIPFALLWVEWFDHRALSKSSTFLTLFSENLNFSHCAENDFLKTFFQTALIWRRFDENLWNQLETVTNIPNFHMQKEALKNIKPLVSY